jgi:WD40 repeat protein
MQRKYFALFIGLMLATGCQLLPHAGFDFEHDKPDPNAWAHGGDAETWRPGIGSLAYSPDGKRLVTSSGTPAYGFFDETRRSLLFTRSAVYELWDTSESVSRAHQKCRVLIVGGNAAWVSVSSNSDVFAVRHKNGVDFCRTEDGALIKRIAPPTDDFSGYHSEVSPDCRFVAWTQNKHEPFTLFGIKHPGIAVASISIQDVASEKIIRTFPQTSTGVSVEKFSPDGRFLAVTLNAFETALSNELTIQLIDLHTGKVSLEIPILVQLYDPQVFFSRDGSTLALLAMSENAAGEMQPGM